MSDTGNLCSKEVTLFTWERRIAIDRGIEVSCANMLDLSGSLDVGRGCLWELNPVVEKGIINPVDKTVNTFAPTLLRPVRLVFLSGIKNTLNYPVVSLYTKDFTPESES